MLRNLTRNYNQDISYILPSGGITLSVPFTFDIKFNKAVENVYVTREIDDADFDQTLITNTTWNNYTYTNYNNADIFPGSIYTSCTNIYFNYVFKTFPSVLFIIVYNRSTEPDLAITAFADNGDGTTNVTCADHGLNSDIDDKIKISGTTNYNCIVNATYVDSDTFNIPIAYIDDDATGIVKLCLTEMIYNQRMINKQKLEGVEE